MLRRNFIHGISGFVTGLFVADKATASSPEITFFKHGEEQIGVLNGEVVCIKSVNFVRFYKNGKFHKDDGPAIIVNDGTKYWYRNGILHRENGPAIEWANGTKEWYQNGLFHREGGPAIIIYNREITGLSYMAWYKYGTPHREDGPAIIYKDGRKFWFKNGNPLKDNENVT